MVRYGEKVESLYVPGDPELRRRKVWRPGRVLMGAVLVFWAAAMWWAGMVWER